MTSKDTVTLQAKVRMSWGSDMLEAGDTFEASLKQARILELSRRALVVDGHSASRGVESEGYSHRMLTAEGTRARSKKRTRRKKQESDDNNEE